MNVLIIFAAWPFLIILPLLLLVGVFATVVAGGYIIVFTAGYIVVTGVGSITGWGAWERSGARRARGRQSASPRTGPRSVLLRRAPAAPAAPRGTLPLRWPQAQARPAAIAASESARTARYAAGDVTPGSRIGH